MAGGPSEFGTIWPTLARRLRRASFLGVLPHHAREDVIQETGMRLFQNWRQLDLSTVWPYTLTVARNIVRDEARRTLRRDPPRQASDERTSSEASVAAAETEAMSRIELKRVMSAIAMLPARDRHILLHELGLVDAPIMSGGALRIARLRARARLRDALDRLSGVVAPTIERLRRLFDPELLSPLAQVGLHHALSIVVVVLGTGSLASPTPPEATESLMHASQRNKVSTSAVTSLGAAHHKRHIPRQEHLSNARHASGRGGETPTVSDSNVNENFVSDDKLNENFGPIRNGDDGVYVGQGGNGWGPYGTHQSFSHSVAGNRMAVEVEATYIPPKCEGEIVVPSGTTYKCDGPGRARGRTRASVNDHNYEASTPSDS